jgi:phage gp36-like protein
LKLEKLLFRKKLKKNAVSKSLIEGFLSEVYGSEEYDRKLAGIISQAEGIVDAYLGSRYVIPVTPTQFIIAISVSLAEYLLHKRGAGGKMLLVFMLI